MYNGVYPAYIRPYTQVKPKTVQRKESEEQSKGSSSNRDETNNGNRNYVPANNYQLYGYRNFQPPIKEKQVNNAQSINVSQIITDFRGTVNAVGAPKEVTEEVLAYLKLIQTQAEKEIPNKKIIQSNLKNASQVLDAYITKTLKTQSNVVENWVDALFLQNIDYKANPNAINEALKLNFEEENNEKTPNSNLIVETSSQENKGFTEKEKKYIPTDEKMKHLFIKAKRAAKKRDPQTALITLKQALNYAVKTEDIKMQSMVYYETADLYNKRGMYPQALKSYKIAADLATDENLIAKSYMKTGKIYDDAGLLEPAKKHWISAIGYAGESENLPIQIKALDNIASVQSEVFDSKSTYTFLNLANNLAEETHDEKIKGYSYKKAFQISNYLDDKSKAMQYLKKSTKSYTKAGDSKNTIENYISAADIMINIGNPLKARALLNKAFMTAIDTENHEALNIISGRIAKLAA